MRAWVYGVSFGLAGFAAASDSSFTGYARSLNTGALLYVESHAVRDVGASTEARVVLYRCAPGAAPFARKELDYAADRLAPSFAMDDARSGVAEGLSRDERGLTVYERPGARAPTRRELLGVGSGLVADAGFDEFVRARWDSLQRGDALIVPFLVPSRLDRVNFRVRKVDDDRIDSEAASVIRLSLAGPLGWFVGDIDVTYRQRDRRLLRYRGITNLRDADGKMIEAQIDFPDSARSAEAVDLPALRALRLSNCAP